jgi:hypothetical protein
MKGPEGITSIINNYTLKPPKFADNLALPNTAEF